MRYIFLIAICLLTITACKVATISDQYGPLVMIENGQFKDMSSYEEYSLTYAEPQDIINTNTPLYRLGIPTSKVSQITVKREAKSSSQGGTIFSAIGDVCTGAAKLAAGVF